MPTLKEQALWFAIVNGYETLKLLEQSGHTSDYCAKIASTVTIIDWPWVLNKCNSFHDLSSYRDSVEMFSALKNGSTVLTDEKLESFQSWLCCELEAWCDAQYNDECVTYDGEVAFVGQRKESYVVYTYNIDGDEVILATLS